MPVCALLPRLMEEACGTQPTAAPLPRCCCCFGSAQTLSLGGPKIGRTTSGMFLFNGLFDV